MPERTMRQTINVLSGLAAGFTLLNTGALLIYWIFGVGGGYGGWAALGYFIFAAQA